MTGLPHRLTARQPLSSSSPAYWPKIVQHGAGLCAAAGLCLLPFLAQAATQTGADIQLTAQRASYELNLEESAGGTTLSASGNMTYTMHDTCTAWSTQQHLDIESTTRDGGVVHLVSDYTTLESKDGRHLAFRTEQKSNNVVLQILAGEATLTPKGGEVRYEKPLRKTLKLPAGTLFPVAHTRAILSAAAKGQPEISLPLFDGTAPDGAQHTYISTFGWKVADAKTAFPILNTLHTARVHVAFFNPNPENMLPDYEMGMRYFANGVSDTLDMDFGDFRMSGTLRQLSIPPAPKKC